MKKAISFRIEEELIQLLKDYAETEELSQADVLERLISTLKVGKVLPDKIEKPKPTDYMTEARFDYRTADIITHFENIFNRLDELEKYKLSGDTYDAAIEFDKRYCNLLETLHPFLISLSQADMDILQEWLKRLQDPRFNTMIGVTPEVFGRRSEVN